MSETNKNEYIEVNISKIFMSFFVTIYKNKKIFLVVFVLCSIFTVVTSLRHSHSIVKQMIKTPSYFDGKGEASILGARQTNLILESTLKQIQSSNPDNALLQQVSILYPFYDYEATDVNSIDFKKLRALKGKVPKKIIKNSNYLLKQKFDQQTSYFTLFVNSKKASNKDVEKVYDSLLKQFSNSPIIKRQIALWQKSLETKLRLDTSNMSKNEDLLKQNQKFLMDLLGKQTNILGMDSQSQSMILKYIGSIDTYQKKIFSLQHSISLIKLKLDNVQPTFSSFGKPFRVKIATPVLSVKMMAVGMFLSLIIAIMASLFIAFFKAVAIAAKRD